MTSSQDSSTLLETLKHLYSRMMALHAENRARSTLNHGTTASSQNIALPLSETIEKLAATAINKPADTTGSLTSEMDKKSLDHAPINREPPPRREPGELSLHLKRSHKYSGISQDTGDRLMNSTWEHFHASIRLARHGNVDAAKVHMELTNNALNEAANYLPEERYSQFSKEVLQALEDINGQI